MAVQTTFVDSCLSIIPCYYQVRFGDQEILQRQERWYRFSRVVVFLPSSVYGIQRDASMSSMMPGFGGSCKKHDTCGSEPVARDHALNFEISKERNNTTKRRQQGWGEFPLTDLAQKHPRRLQIERRSRRRRGRPLLVSCVGPSQWLA